MNTEYHHDPVADDLNRYLKSVDDSEIRESHIQHHVDILLHQHGEMYPFRAENLGEALANLADPEIGMLADILAGREWHLAGKALAALVKEYWEKEARAKTVAQMED